jgi:hypothetical protein
MNANRLWCDLWRRLFPPKWPRRGSARHRRAERAARPTGFHTGSASSPWRRRRHRAARQRFILTKSDQKTDKFDPQLYDQRFIHNIPICNHSFRIPTSLRPRAWILGSGYVHTFGSGFFGYPYVMINYYHAWTWVGRKVSPRALVAQNPEVSF